MDERGQRAFRRYTARFCEENVWHLAQAPDLAARERWVVFITNAARTCPVWRQRAADAPGEPVVWDYHVVLLVNHPVEIWDLDSTLTFPCPAARYLRETFPRADQLAPAYAPWFRVVPAALFRERFASDRSHMRGPDGAFVVPPPPGPPICTATETMNLMQFVELTTPGLGEVLDLPRLLERVAALERSG